MYFKLTLTGLVATLFIGCSVPDGAVSCSQALDTRDRKGIYGDLKQTDVLVVMDNSPSMKSLEGAVLRGVHEFFESIIDSPDSWPYPPVDDLRVAVITSDMGLSWGSEVPGSTGDDLVDQRWARGCEGYGDDGRFQGDFLFDELGELGFVSNSESVDDIVESARVGNGGCPVEQPLRAAIRALERDDQAEFLREFAHLVVIVVSDEDDCSVATGPGFFDSDEFLQMASAGSDFTCPDRADSLLPLPEFAKRFSALRWHGSVMLFAITGVPEVEECMGRSGYLGACLDEPGMQLGEADVASTGKLGFAPACTSDDFFKGHFSATPARRLVELAADHQELGFIHSVCSRDWTPPAQEVAMMGTDFCQSDGIPLCTWSELPWNPDSSEPLCELYFEYHGLPQCPPAFGDESPIIEVVEEKDGESSFRTLCKVPKIPVGLQCPDDSSELEEEGFGWFYCENKYREDFAETCDPDEGVDNDGDGLTDCEDPGCKDCRVCGGEVDCSDECRFKLGITLSLREEAYLRPFILRCTIDTGDVHGDCSGVGPRGSDNI